MTISSTTRKAGPFVGSGSTGPFSFAFKVFQDSDLLVVTADSSGVETDLVLTTDYTVSLNANQDTNPGGTVTLVAPLAVGYTMVIGSQVPYTQQTELTNQGGFYPQVITNALDKLTIQTQQLKETVDRSFQVPITSEVDAAQLSADVILVADNADSVNTVASNITSVNAVAAIDSDVTVVAANVQDVTNFAGVYFGPSATDPTARHDASPLQIGDLYFNTNTEKLRVYNGSAWSDAVTPVAMAIEVQRFSGNSSTTAFTLTYTPAFTNAAEVYISGVAQVAGTDYTVSGSTLTFTSAPPTGTNNIYVRTLASMAAGVPNAGSVTPSKLSTGGPSWDSSGNLSFNSGYGSAVAAYGCRAWINFDGTTTPVTIRNSKNITSVTKNDTGDYTINFTTAFPDANYALIANGGGSTNCSVNQADTPSRSASSCLINVIDSYWATFQDATQINIAVFR